MFLHDGVGFPLFNGGVLEVNSGLMYFGFMGHAVEKLHKFLVALRDKVDISQEKLSSEFFDLDAVHAVGDSRISDIERKDLPSYGLAKLYDQYFGTGETVRKLTKNALLERHGFNNKSSDSGGGFRFTVELIAIHAASTRYPLNENLLIGPSPDKLWLPSYRHLKPESIIRSTDSDDVSFVFDFAVTVTHQRVTRVFDSVAELGSWRESNRRKRFLCVNLIGHYWTREQLPAALRLLSTPKTASRHNNNEDDGVDVDLTSSFEERFITENLHPPAVTDFSVEGFFYGAATATSYAAHHLTSSTVDDNDIVSYVTQLQAVKYLANRAVRNPLDGDLEKLKNLRLALAEPLQKGRQFTHITNAVKVASEVEQIVDHAIGKLEHKKTTPPSNTDPDSLRL